jgi:hypothetical protein
LGKLNVSLPGFLRLLFEGMQRISGKGDGSIFSVNKSVPFYSFMWMSQNLTNSDGAWSHPETLNLPTTNAVLATDQ